MIENRQAAGFIREIGDGCDHVMEIVGGNLAQFRVCSVEAIQVSRERRMTSQDRTKPVLSLAAVAMVALAFTGASASADLVATDLNVGGIDTGFSGGWQGSNNVFIVDANDLTYANYNITQTGTTQKVYSGNTPHPDRMDSRNLAAAMSGEMWFSALVNVPTGTNFAGLAFDSDPWDSSGSAKYSHQLSELRVVLTTSQLVVDMDGGSPPTATGTETGTFAADTTHLILGNMNVGAGEDMLSVWVDPDLNAALPAANFTSTTVDFMDSVVRIGVPASGWTGTDGVFIDAIRLSNTETAFFDVTGVTGSLPGDADGDGDVDAADYIALKANMGTATGAVLADGDFDEDGDVDWDDLQLLQDNYGAGSAGGALPEPGSAILLMLGAAAMLRRRRG